jgi:hypothetical protein
MPGIGLVGDPSVGGGAAVITLRGSDGFDRCIWVDTLGKLRIADVADCESASWNPDSAGTIVGTQS